MESDEPLRNAALAVCAKAGAWRRAHHLLPQATQDYAYHAALRACEQAGSGMDSMGIDSYRLSFTISCTEHYK